MVVGHADESKLAGKEGGQAVISYPRQTVDYFVKASERSNSFSFSSPAFDGIVKAAQTLPTYLRRGKQPTPSSLAARQVPGSALSDWWLSLPPTLTPTQVDTILRGSLAGNLWQQHQLAQLMADSWPTFRKCVNEIRTAAKMVSYKVSPYTFDDKKQPTDSAIEKANFVRRCFAGFEPDRFAEEDAFKGMVYDLCGGLVDGVSICELLWNVKKRGPTGRPENTIRASAWVHPRHYAVTENGSLGVADDKERANPMAFHSVMDKPIINNPDKYLVAKYKSKSGSCLGAGEMRCLAVSWVNIVFAVDWVRNCGQKYGTPFMSIPYTPGIPGSEREKFEEAAKRAAALGALVYPQQNPNQKVDIHPAATMSQDNPIRVMIDLAEKWCVQLILGQTLTSDTGDGGKGGSSYALGKVHGQVKQEKLEAVADWLAEVLEKQLAVSLLRQNYGETDECPKVAADFTHVESPAEAATRLGTVVTQCKFPVVAEEAYQVIGLKQPQPGDQVLVNGQIVIQDEPMTGDEKFEKQLEQQVQQAEASMALQADAQGGAPDQGGRGQEDQQAIAAAQPWGNTDRLRAILARATAEQLAELEPLVVRAKSAPVQNGEWAAVAVKVKAIDTANRIDLFTKASRT